MRLSKLLIFWIAATASFSQFSLAGAASENLKNEARQMSDFGFLIGKWTITHKRLNNPFHPEPNWMTFKTDYEAWQLLGGLANMDKTYGIVNGDYFEGVSVRTYDKNKNEWVIYWMDVWNTTLREQVRGSFEDGVGTFYGEEKHKGVVYPMRFLWKNISHSKAVWEQAYQNPDTGGWETNWIMEFEKAR